MTYLAFRNLWQQKFRLALSIVGVALAIMLIVLLNGFLAGVEVQITAYLDNTPSDLIIAQDGVTNLLSASSILPGTTEELAQDVAGIADISPIISQFIIMDFHDKKVVAYLVGYEVDKGGGPWEMKSGREPIGDDEIVLDWVMAKEHGFALGDTVKILDTEFTVVGLSNNTNSWMASFVFVRKSAAEKLFIMPGAASFYLLSLAPDADLAGVRANLVNQLPNVEIVTANEMKQNDLTLLVEIFAIPLKMMVSIAFLVGTAILGMVIYTATLERQKEYGVLKAVGVKNRSLYWLVTVQGLTIAVVGVAAGIGLGNLAAVRIMEAVPKFTIILENQSIVITALTGVVMGLVAALLPARQVGQLDPARVFRK